MSSPRLRSGRFSEVGAHYAVTTLTHERVRMFVDDALATLVKDEIQNRVEAETLAWVVMPDHLHWLFALRANSLCDLMRRFKSRSAIAINRRRGSSGPVWQAGYFDHRIRAEADLKAQAMYLIANPMRAGLVKRVADYRYLGCVWQVQSAGGAAGQGLDAPGESGGSLAGQARLYRNSRNAPCCPARSPPRAL